MLRATGIGIVSAIALGVGLASPAAAMGGHVGGHGSMGGSMGGSAMRAGAVNHSPSMAMRSDSAGGRFVQHDMGGMRMTRDHDHDRDHDRDHGRHDHDRFRFFPAFAFGVNTYSDVYDPTYGDCWELHRVWTHAHWHLRRIWVCS
jgi:hypothetical protein